MEKSVRKVYIEFFGCKLNQSEVESLSVDFARAGCRPVKTGYGADICVVNTCTVTHVADRKVRQWVRRIRRINPNALLVATGCYAERNPEELQSLDKDMLIVSNNQKHNIVSMLKECGCLDGSGQSHALNMKDFGRTRSLIRIQEGCAARCSYCIVPSVRPGYSSRPPGEIIQEIKSRLTAGFQEVVLTGTEVGCYYSKDHSLNDLINRVLKETGVKRLRLTSLQPQQINPALTRLWEDNRLAPHFHLPLQSGSSEVLERMKRGYSIEEYLAALELIRSKVKDVSITTDVITGFPGETGRDFLDTIDICRRAGFARIHVFPYSRRPLTAAWGMPGHIDSRVIKEREAELLKLADQAARDFMLENKGRVMPVLWEASSNGVWSGLTPNYIRVYRESNVDLYNTITEVKLGGLWRDGVEARNV